MPQDYAKGILSQGLIAFPEPVVATHVVIGNLHRSVSARIGDG
jgi:hypothetical protein